MVEDLEALFARLQKSKFRSGFKLKNKELEYFNQKGLTAVIGHGRDFITKRLAPANPPNDGKQTPFAKHPVFVAQHATATCCRGCLEKWYKIPKNKELNSKEVGYILYIIEFWLRKSLGC
ncbi:MAG: DUF4186 domain-containing protein [Thermodesulfobacteriota bacterium]